MRSVTLWQIEMWPWYALGIVWAIAATRLAKDAQLRLILDDSYGIAGGTTPLAASF